VQARQEAVQLVSPPPPRQRGSLTLRRAEVREKLEECLDGLKPRSLYMLLATAGSVAGDAPSDQVALHDHARVDLKGPPSPSAVFAALRGEYQHLSADLDAVQKHMRKADEVADALDGQGEYCRASVPILDHFDHPSRTFPSPFPPPISRRESLQIHAFDVLALKKAAPSAGSPPRPLEGAYRRRGGLPPRRLRPCRREVVESTRNPLKTLVFFTGCDFNICVDTDASAKDSRRAQWRGWMGLCNEEKSARTIDSFANARNNGFWG
jgi:hypothetical protein